MSRRLRLDIEYDGTDFAGWQIQPNERTIQGEIAEALSTILRQPVSITGAGRTDAGVHARGQVAHVDVPDDAPEPYRILAGVNALTGRDIAVYAARYVSDDFHARFSARSRTYAYRISLRPTAIDRRLTWQVPGELDVVAMQQAAERLVGRYPATTWCAAGAEDRDAIVDVRSAKVSVVGPQLVFAIRADRFVMHMVRTIVGTLVEIGHGKRTAQSIPDLIDARDRSSAGETAPARGLCLEHVE
ncbi:MAG TPA: tRNA pseudouridine(38-40) synthase TruA [Firmicutes bacterium]|nr:tRNA pseudouridine(38-40) synthase TruA [Bacillota bacterium]